MRPTLEEIRDLFHRHHLRCTRQRELLYAALAESHSHPTAEDLYHAVQTVDPGLSLATVYNTLDAFTDCGLSRKVSSPGAGPCRYDATTEPHVHLCTPAGDVVDVPHDLGARLLAGLSPELIREIEQRMGVQVSRVNVQVIADGPGSIPHA